MSLEEFIRSTDSLVEFDMDLNANIYPVDSIHAIDLHKEEVKSKWARIKSAYDESLCEIESEQIAVKSSSKKAGKESEKETVDLESVKVKYRSAYITYCNCLARLSGIADTLRVGPKVDLSKSSPDSEILASSSKNSNLNHLHLPPCDIKQFNGDYSSWPTFRDLFEAVYIKNSRLSPIEKLLHLTNKTSGEAREIVAKAPLTNQGFEEAWKNLCVRFDNEKVLVHQQIRTLLNLQSIDSESGPRLRHLQRDINAVITSLRLYGIEVKSWEPLFVLICNDRLPEATLNLWEQSVNDKTKLQPWAAMDAFLTDRCRTLESVAESRSSNKSKSLNSKPKTTPQTSSSSKNVKSFQTSVKDPKCPLCPKEFHTIRKCPRFLKMDQSQRLNEIKKQNLCINCFSGAHTVKNCNSRNNCFACQKRHNTLLHKDSVISNPPTPNPPSHNTSSSLNPNSTPFPSTSKSSKIQSTGNSGAGVVQTFFTRNSRGVLLGTALVDVCHLGRRYQARALIDPASEGSFISEEFSNFIKLPKRRTKPWDVSGLGDFVSASTRSECSFILGSPSDNSVEILVDALIVKQVTDKLPSQPMPMEYFSDLPQIHLADPQFYKGAQVDLLIGGEVFPSIMCSEIKHEVCKSLIAQETIFGWILTGPVPLDSSNSNAAISSFVTKISLEKEISRFWEVEDLPRKNFATPSDEFCEDLYVKTTKRDINGRYIVSLPFKEGYPGKFMLGDSRNSSMAQFFRNEGRLLHSPTFKEEYDRVVEEYVQLEHMHKVAPPALSKHPQHYYLPHHAVIKPDSTTTKVRVVFNASSRSSTGLSLNDVLHVGPVLQNDLTLLILKWRFFRYVFNADIQKMYRQILVNPDHTPFQRILFRKDPSEIVQDYELKTVTFGVNCAPYLAIRTIIQLANDVQATYPLASDILRNSMYVDDALAGAHSIPDAIKARNELILALQSAGFSLRKWTANSKEVLLELPPDHLLNEDFLDFDDSSTAKTLGIRWNALTDCFYFSAKPLPESTTFTKREVLSQIAKLFDPAGWLSPCVILAKIIMQQIWIDGTEWDDILSPGCLSQWKDFLSNYSYINDIRIPRWINFTPDAEVQFHGFCDASEKAYAAAIYIRIVDNNSISTHLVSSKTKLAPVKTLSIPRLELCGALLLAEMIDSLLPRLNVEKYSVFCWTDSTIVLSWLAKPPCAWLTFVANRVSKITQIIDPQRWYHVASEDNPADLASRGVFPRDLRDNELWWCGPKWLQSPTVPVPSLDSQFFGETDLEKKSIKVHFTYFNHFEDVLERFSSFSRAMRVMSYVYRFYYRTHPKYRFNYSRETTAISSSEILAVRDRLIIMYQKVSYPNEYKALKSQLPISSSSSLLNLNPFLDQEGIIRSCGRLESSNGLSFNERHPIILPYTCQYSRLLVQFVHDISLHGGNQLVLRIIRSLYWIPKVKNLIKATINKCKVCVIYKKRCQKQIMAALPPERTQISRPFTHTGLDFAGPFDIKSYSGRACRISKGYVCVFVCFSTKAIHLEATSDLSTPVFLAAFCRFVSRRGCPLHLHSDNGTTFVGASKVLAKEFMQASHKAITDNYAHQNLTWHFIPPGAPHMGGLWEAGVKSFKSHFRKVSGNVKYTFEEFSTLLSRIESCLNSRPLSPMSQDPSDFSALTPGHFLIGSPILAPIDPQIDEPLLSIRNRWERLKAIHQHFCLRWKSEYVKELQKRVKWQKPEENLQENSLVVIKDENLPPNSWRLGRIEKVCIGPDKRVRVADVFTQKGTTRRPITKLVVLPIES